LRSRLWEVIHVTKKMLTLLFVLSSLVLVPMAFADKGGKGNGNGGAAGRDPSSLGLVMVNDLNGNGTPDYGDSVTFNVSTTASSSPYVDVYCYQGGTLVYAAEAGFYTNYPWPNDFILTAPTWASGAASCTATIVYYDHGKLVSGLSTPFSVGA
jgi:hypothetical protein